MNIFILPVNTSFDCVRFLDQSNRHKICFSLQMLKFTPIYNNNGVFTDSYMNLFNKTHFKNIPKDMKINYLEFVINEYICIAEYLESLLKKVVKDYYLTDIQLNAIRNDRFNYYMFISECIYKLFLITFLEDHLICFDYKIIKPNKIAFKTKNSNLYKMNLELSQFQVDFMNDLESLDRCKFQIKKLMITSALNPSIYN